MNSWQRDLLRERRLKYAAEMHVWYARLINRHCGTLGGFKDLPLHEQSMLLLERLEVLFGKQTFDPNGHTASQRLAEGFAYREERDAYLYVLTDPWSEVVRAGYVAEAPPGSGMYEITAKGFVAIHADDDKMPF
jgi:hypothetical protein